MTLIPPPPPVLLAGTRIPAGLGVSVVTPDIDFETYSEAGYAWDAERQRWTSPPGATGVTRGLPLVGAAVYAEHPTADLLCLAYDLKDGTGRSRWRPGDPPPLALWSHVMQGRVLEAWNVGFERHLWNKVLVPRYGFPPWPLRQQRCAMAKARAWSLPGALGTAAAVLSQPGKDKEGGRLLDKFAKPRNPTKADARRRILPADDPEDFRRLQSYNEQDIAAEADVAAYCPDLEGEELEFWFVDQAVNIRGVAVDRAGVRDCIALIEEAHTQYNAELHALTAGTVEKASEIQKLLGWLGAQGCHMGSLDEEAVSAALRGADTNGAVAFDGGTLIPPEPMLPAVRRALEIRQAVGSASVKKVYAMDLQATRADRLHDLFSYHAARTGRATGNGPQPTNLPREGPPVVLCKACNHYHGTHTDRCPWCGMPGPPGRKPADWCIEAVEDALRVIAGRSLALVQQVYGDAMATVSGCLRGLFVAGPGRELIASDFSAIEAVVLAALAGESWRLDVFRAKRDIYVESISRVTGVPVSEYEAYKANSGKHHPDRQRGKIAELACFTADTQVLTRRGYVAIVAVRNDDQLWDGVEWVNHAGVIAKGSREVLTLDGVQVTPQHPMVCGGSWREARQLAGSPSMLAQALASGSENLPSLPWIPRRKSASSVTAARRLTSFTSAICIAEKQLAAMFAPRKPADAARNVIGNTPTYAPTTSTAADYSIAWPLVSNVATMLGTLAIPTMAGAASSCTSRGGPIAALFSHISSLCRDGISRLWSLTARTWTKAISPAICDSSLYAPTEETSAAYKLCSDKCENSKPVYDIAHAGPRNRFTIRTNSGHLLVHNSGYQGWIGAWLAFGAGAHMNDDEIKQAILAWRDASPTIVEFWGGQQRREGWNRWDECYGVEGAAIGACLVPDTQIFVLRRDGSHTGVSFRMHGDALYCTLPSGRHLTYHRPRLTPSDRAAGTWSLSYEGYNTNPKNGGIGWITIRTWGGRLVENIVQAVARDILRHAMVNLEAAGYPIVLHVYDEIVAEVPEGWGSIEEFERIMATLPAWCAGWPVRADGGWRGQRYRKG